MDEEELELYQVGAPSSFRKQPPLSKIAKDIENHLRDNIPETKSSKSPRFVNNISHIYNRNNPNYNRENSAPVIATNNGARKADEVADPVPTKAGQTVKAPTVETPVVQTDRSSFDDAPLGSSLIPKQQRPSVSLEAPQNNPVSLPEPDGTQLSTMSPDERARYFRNGVNFQRYDGARGPDTTELGSNRNYHIGDKLPDDFIAEGESHIASKYDPPGSINIIRGNMQGTGNAGYGGSFDITTSRPGRGEGRRLPSDFVMENSMKALNPKISLKSRNEALTKALNASGDQDFNDNLVAKHKEISDAENSAADKKAIADRLGQQILAEQAAAKVAAFNAENMERINLGQEPLPRPEIQSEQNMKERQEERRAQALELVEKRNVDLSKMTKEERKEYLDGLVDYVGL